MKLSMVLLQLAAVAFATLAGSASAQSTCTIRATDQGSGSTQACNELDSCFNAASTTISPAGGNTYTIPVLPNCQPTLGSTVELTLNSAGTELSGTESITENGSTRTASLTMTGSKDSYTVVYKPSVDGSAQCTIPFTTSSGTCPVSASSDASYAAGAAASVALAGAAGALAAWTA